MKIIVTGSQEELTGLIKRLIADKLTAEKNEDLPPLLTKLAEDEKINKFAKAMCPALEKINESAKRRKENTPQVEAAEQNLNQEFFVKQMELLSQASKDCLTDISLYQYLAPLTQAMIMIEFLRA